MRTLAGLVVAVLVVAACGSSSGGGTQATFCARAKTLQAQDEQSGSGAGSTQEQSAEFHSLAKVAPSEIKGDVEMFAHALDLAAANDTVALKAQRAKIVQATRALDDYLANTCGLATVSSTT
jgi:hypothetical protein